MELWNFQKIWRDFKGHSAHLFLESQYFCYWVVVYLVFRHDSSIDRELSSVSCDKSDWCVKYFYCSEKRVYIDIYIYIYIFTYSFSVALKNHRETFSTPLPHSHSSNIYYHYFPWIVSSLKIISLNLFTIRLIFFY